VWQQTSLCTKVLLSTKWWNFYWRHFMSASRHFMSQVHNLLVRLSAVPRWAPFYVINPIDGWAVVHACVSLDHSSSEWGGDLLAISPIKNEHKNFMHKTDVKNSAKSVPKSHQETRQQERIRWHHPNQTLIVRGKDVKCTRVSFPSQP